MGEILFKGKRTDGKGWAEGCLIHTPKYCCILQDEKEAHPMDYPFLNGGTGCIDGYAAPILPESVGQFTGRTDKNAKRIFEGDIVTGLFLFGLSVNAVVKFQDGAFGLEWYRGDVKTFNAFTSICNVEYEVIGNIHDNPELLEGGE